MDNKEKITIRIKDATKIYGEQIVLNQVSLEMKSGVIYGFVGQNGSGKTVLFKSICGFTKLSKGQIEVLGKVVGEDVDMAESVGVIIENPGFLANYNAFKNLKFLAALTNKIDNEEIRRNIALVGLNPDSKKKVGKFSLGMRQRLGIAQAIMENPEILILDEPFNGMDKNGTKEIRELLLRMKEEGKTILLASHSADDIEILCDEVYEMEMGVCSKKLQKLKATSDGALKARTIRHCGVKEPNLLWPINKYLKARVMTEGVFEESEEGSAQGNIISPILANIYMHNVLTLWYKFVIKSNTLGNSFLAVYADDFIAGFQYKEDAEKYYALLKERLKKFNLELEESKSRMIEFGRYAESNPKDSVFIID